nr:MAG TPA: UBA-like domain protein [Caudoviricetes sp.]
MTKRTIRTCYNPVKNITGINDNFTPWKRIILS